MAQRYNVLDHENRSARIMLPCSRHITRSHSSSLRPSQRLTSTSPTVPGTCERLSVVLHHANLASKAFLSSTVLHLKRVSCAGRCIHLPLMPRATGRKQP